MAASLVKIWEVFFKYLPLAQIRNLSAFIWTIIELLRLNNSSDDTYEPFFLARLILNVVYTTPASNPHLIHPLLVGLTPHLLIIHPLVFIFTPHLIWCSTLFCNFNPVFFSFFLVCGNFNMCLFVYCFVNFIWSHVTMSLLSLPSNLFISPLFLIL